MSIRSTDGEIVKWTARQARKIVGNRVSAVTVMMEPATVRGFALLVRDGAGAPDTLWMYLPPVRRVRQLQYAGSDQSFLGTDFTYADIGFMAMRTSTSGAVERVRHEGQDAYRLEEVPVEPGLYSRIVTWVSPGSHLPVDRSYYDRAGELWKVASYRDVAEVDGVATIMTTRVEDKQVGGWSEMKLSEVEYDVDLSDELFKPEALADLSERKFR